MTETSGVPRFDDWTPPETYAFEVVLRTRTGEPVVKSFRARKTLTGGSFMQLAMAKTDLAMANAYARIILESCDDTDGLSFYYELPTNDDGSLFDPFSIAEADRSHPESPVDPRWYDREQWSSRKRMAFLLVEDNELEFPAKTLERLSEYLMENSAERPTWKPSRSSRGQEAIATGSEGSSSSLASTPSESQQPNG